VVISLGGGASPAAAAGSGWPGHSLGHAFAWGAPYARFGGIFGDLGFPGFGIYGFGGAPALTAGVGGAPFAVAVDQATHTAYVGNTNDNTVSVINTATCNAAVTTDCVQAQPPISVDPAAGVGLVDAAVDEKTDTVYVVNLFTTDASSTTGYGNTISVISGATCNSAVTTGCGQVPEEITLGNDPDDGVGPDGVAVDEATDTIYVADVADNSVSVINGATCNGKVVSGCSQTPATVALGPNTSPEVPAVDQATDTVYVPNNGDGTVSVIDGATCNASVTTGCTNTPPRLSVSGGPGAAAVDQATNTVYIASAAGSDGAGGPGSVDVINGATCDATVTSGCGQTPPSVPVGSNPDDLVVDPVTQSVFVVNQLDSTVSVIDGASCNALDTAGCGQRPPDVAAGFFSGYLDVDIASDTVYVANNGGGAGDTVSVLNGALCTLTRQLACRHVVPTTTVGAGGGGEGADGGSAVNIATGTIYVANAADGDVSVIDAATCNAFLAFRCGGAWPTVAVGAGSFPQAIAVNRLTDTIYVANEGDNTVSVINGASCNASNTSGCGQIPASVTVGMQPIGLDVDEATNTIYVANADFGGPGTVSMIDGATCNGVRHSGCTQTPIMIPVGSQPGPSQPGPVAVNQTNNTVYVASGTGAAGTVSVINGATCNATHTAGCGQTAAVTVGAIPVALAVNAVTDTVYVVNLDNDISVVNGATCNATSQSGCYQTPPTLGAGTAPSAITVDPVTDRVYATSTEDSDTDVYNGATCNRTVSSGCPQTPLSVPVGGFPGNPLVDQANDTVYVPDSADGDVSYFPAGF
jgi:DNA-binding beta-propeller fold protein YncE